MRVDTDKPRTSWVWLLVLVALMSGFSFYIIDGLNRSKEIYKATMVELEKPEYRGSVSNISFPDTDGGLNIPSWELFQNGNLWMLVSRSHPLNSDFAPKELVTVTLPQGDAGTQMQISKMIQAPLASMFEAADRDGYPLMISSAYRSIADQQQLYQEFVNSRGQDQADMYVADPGSSEHHTGLAVDLSDSSDACAADSDRCLIAPATSQWLADNAHRFGFIVRYPEGAQPITGVAYEPWHYRYVGVPLATKLYESNLTLDEALTQMYPAFD